MNCKLERQFPAQHLHFPTTPGKEEGLFQAVLHVVGYKEYHEQRMVVLALGGALRHIVSVLRVFPELSSNWNKNSACQVGLQPVQLREGILRVKVGLVNSWIFYPMLIPAFLQRQFHGMKQACNFLKLKQSEHGEGTNLNAPT